MRLANVMYVVYICLIEGCYHALDMHDRHFQFKSEKL